MEYLLTSVIEAKTSEEINSLFNDNLFKVSPFSRAKFTEACRKAKRRIRIQERKKAKSVQIVKSILSKI